MLTQAVMRGLLIGMYWNSHTWSSSDANVQSNWRLHVIMHGLLETYFKIKSQWWARKEIHLCVRVGKKNPSLGIAVSSSLVKRWSSGSHPHTYEGCSNMNASSFITFFTYTLRQSVTPFWKELYAAFKMALNIKTHSLFFSSYRPLYKGHSCILKFFWSKLRCTFLYIGDIVSYLCKF